MKKLLKFGFILIGLLIALIVVTAISIPMFFDPNDYKSQIVERVEKETGRKFQLDGDLKLSIFPWLGVEIGGMTFGNAAGFGEQPMVKSSLVQARVKLLPLLKKNIEMDTVTLKDATVNLARDENGKSNWDDLLTPGGEKEVEKSDGAALGTLTLGGIDMEDANLVWDDKNAGKYYAIKNLNLKTGKLQMNEPIDLDMDFNLHARTEGIAGAVALGGTIEYDLEAEIYSLSPLDFSADMQGESLPGGAAAINLKANAVNADLSAETASLEGLLLLVMGAEIKGDVNARNILDPVPLANGEITITASNITELLKALGQDPDQVPLKSLNAHAKFSSDKQTMTFETLSAKAVLEGGQFKNPVDIKMDANGNVNVEKQTLNLPQFSVEGLGALIKGNFAAKNIFEPTPLLAGKLNIVAQDVPNLLKAAGQDASDIPLKSFIAATVISSTLDSISLKTMKAKATLAGEQIPNSPVDVILETSVDINLAKETLNVKSLIIKGMGLDVQGAVKGVHIIKDPKLNGQLKIAPFNLRKLMTQLKMEVPVTADPKVLSQAAVNTDFSASKNSFALKGLQLKLDETNIKADLAVANFSSPSTAFKLIIDTINVDRYLPPVAENEQAKLAKPATSETAAQTAADLPMDTLRKLKIKGSLNIANLIISKVKLQNVMLGLDAKDGKINLSPINANLYQGSYSGAISLNATGSQPIININSALKGVQAGPLFEDLNGESKVDGSMTSNIKITAAGADADTIKKTLNGTTNFVFTNGALKGFNIADIVRRTKNKLTGQNILESTGPAQTDFSELNGSATIKNGLVSNQDLSIKSPLLRIDGKGTANLVNEKINYSVSTTFVSSLKGQGGKGLEDLKGITIPIKVSGTFSDPSFAPDMGGFLKARAQQEIDKQKDKIKEKAAEKLEKLVPGLGGLLGGGNEEQASGDSTVPIEQEVSPKESSPLAEEKKPEDQVKDKLKELLPF